MSTQRYSVSPHPIETLLTWVKSGEIAIPEIQRPFVWEATQVETSGLTLPRLSCRLSDRLAQSDGAAQGRDSLRRQTHLDRRPAAGNRPDGGPARARGSDEGLRDRPHSDRVPSDRGEVRGCQPRHPQGCGMDRGRVRHLRARRQDARRSHGPTPRRTLAWTRMPSSPRSRSSARSSTIT